MKFLVDIPVGRQVEFQALNILRLLAAILVVCTHAWVFTNRMTVSAVFLGRFAVDAFFIISGFLITKSWESSNSLTRYAMKRVLRILPGLFAVVFFCALVLGPIFTNMSSAGYFSDGATYRYLLNSVLYIHPTLPGVFGDNPQTSRVNGPLWTLPYEVTTYAAIAVCGLVFGNNLRFAVLATYLLLLGLDLSYLAPSVDYAQFGLVRNANEFSTYFLGGSVVWSFRKNFMLRWYIALPAVLVLIFRSEINFDGVVWYLALPYVVLWLGLRDLPEVSWLKHLQRNDYSYGVYIWGAPMQQSLVAVIGPCSLLANLLLAIALTGGAAFCSWHLVEKRCLQLKGHLNRPAGQPGPGQ